MSIVEIAHHDEVIYTILDKPPPDPPKTPRYHSKLEKELKARKIPQLRLTFGCAVARVNPPDNYLRKGDGRKPVVKSDHKCLKGDLPPVPRRPPPGKAPEKPKVNFKIQNIKKAIKGKPRQVEPRMVDTRDGHIKKIKGSGEVPEYCLRPDFGRMPAYLLRRNKRVKRELDAIQYADDHKESLCKQLAEQEREKLLQELKYKWQLKQKAFLQLPMLTDTVPKIMKKDKMEQELRQLEKDILLVESNPYIYIYE